MEPGSGVGMAKTMLRRRRSSVAGEKMSRPTLKKARPWRWAPLARVG